MGLCKCPKRRVTNLFCFEHRVNVCESCMADAHGACIVSSYLAWLMDSTFSSACVLCSHSLKEGGELCRLPCLHLYHWPCVDAWGRAHPPNTAPAGFRCPTCREALLPPPQVQSSPLVDRLHSQLQRSTWARAALGLPHDAAFDGPAQPIANILFAPTDPQAAAAVYTPQPPASFYGASQNGGSPAPAARSITPSSNYRASTPAVVLDLDKMYVPEGVPSARKKAGIATEASESQQQQPFLPNGRIPADRNVSRRRDADAEQFKYERRPLSDWFSSLLLSRGLPTPRLGRVGRVRRVLYAAILAGGIFALFIFMSKSREETYGGENDVLFDPAANPNIRNAEDGGSHF